MQQVWKIRWRKIGWVTLGAVTILLLGAGVYKKNHKTCTGIEVSFDGEGANFFIDEKGVTEILKSNGVKEGVEIDRINLRELEGILKNDNWIANAELYFDNKQVLKAYIKEKEPVARLFTVDGGSFYIDSSCNRLPLSQNLSARIPMFTGFPSDKVNMSKPDSELLYSAKDLAVFIQSDDFWKAQIAQIDITPNGFEIIPTVGNHVILLGKNGDYQKKFDRLFSFYKQVWTKVGFEAYEKVDVRFEGQVVATVKGAEAKAAVDSAIAIAALKNLVEHDKPDTVENDITNKPVVVNQPKVRKDSTSAKAGIAGISVTANSKVNAANKPNAGKKAAAVKNVSALSKEEEKIMQEATNQAKQEKPKASLPKKAIQKNNTPLNVKVNKANIKVNTKSKTH